MLSPPGATHHQRGSGRQRPRMSAELHDAHPLVAVSACRRIIEPHPFHVAGEKYLMALADAAGVLPVIMPALPDEGFLAALLDRVDGVFLTGAYSNVEPKHYGGAESRSDVLHDPARDVTTLPLIHGAIDKSVPLFAVCRGFQEVNVAMGGTLHQHVEEVSGYCDHREDTREPLDVQYGPAHVVNLVEGGTLHSIAGSATATVNSLHSQGVAQLGDNLSVEAIADDGLVEGFRVDRHKGFAIGVQWHPEWRVLENDFARALFAAFGDACRAYAARRG